jgi:adenylate kinase family enzyme
MGIFDNEGAKVPLKKIMIIGSGGAGKSTLARQLGDLLSIEVIHLDAEFWQPHWTETPKSEWISRQKELIQKEQWIMDGNFGGTMDVRIEAADTIIFLDIPVWVCLFRVVKRRIKYHGKTRPDMGKDCPERLHPEFLTWILAFRKTKRPILLQKLEQVKSIKNVYHFTTRKEIKQFLEKIKESTHSVNNRL